MEHPLKFAHIDPIFETTIKFLHEKNSVSRNSTDDESSYCESLAPRSQINDMDGQSIKTQNFIANNNIINKSDSIKVGDNTESHDKKDIDPFYFYSNKPSRPILNSGIRGAESCYILSLTPTTGSSGNISAGSTSLDGWGGCPAFNSSVEMTSGLHTQSLNDSLTSFPPTNSRGSARSSNENNANNPTHHTSSYQQQSPIKSMVDLENIFYTPNESNWKHENGTWERVGQDNEHNMWRQNCSLRSDRTPAFKKFSIEEHDTSNASTLWHDGTNSSMLENLSSSILVEQPNNVAEEIRETLSQNINLSDLEDILGRVKEKVPEISDKMNSFLLQFLDVLARKVTEKKCLESLMAQKSLSFDREIWRIYEDTERQISSERIKLLHEFERKETFNNEELRRMILTKQDEIDNLLKKSIELEDKVASLEQTKTEKARINKKLQKEKSLLLSHLEESRKHQEKLNQDYKNLSEKLCRANMLSQGNRTDDLLIENLKAEKMELCKQLELLKEYNKRLMDDRDEMEARNNSPTNSMRRYPLRKRGSILADYFQSDLKGSGNMNVFDNDINNNSQDENTFLSSSSDSEIKPLRNVNKTLKNVSPSFPSLPIKSPKMYHQYNAKNNFDKKVEKTSSSSIVPTRHTVLGESVCKQKEPSTILLRNNGMEIRSVSDIFSAAKMYKKNLRSNNFSSHQHHPNNYEFNENKIADTNYSVDSQNMPKITMAQSTGVLCEHKNIKKLLALESRKEKFSCKNEKPSELIRSGAYDKKDKIKCSLNDKLGSKSTLLKTIQNETLSSNQMNTVDNPDSQNLVSPISGYENNKQFGSFPSSTLLSGFQNRRLLPLSYYECLVMRKRSSLMASTRPNSNSIAAKTSSFRVVPNDDPSNLEHKQTQSRRHSLDSTLSTGSDTKDIVETLDFTPSVNVLKLKISQPNALIPDHSPNTKRAGNTNLPPPKISSKTNSFKTSLKTRNLSKAIDKNMIEYEKNSDRYTCPEYSLLVPENCNNASQTIRCSNFAQNQNINCNCGKNSNEAKIFDNENYDMNSYWNKSGSPTLSKISSMSKQSDSTTSLSPYSCNNKTNHEFIVNNKLLVRKSSATNTLSLRGMGGKIPPARVFKVILLGDVGVGKTTFIHQACHQHYCQNFVPTLNMDFQVKRVMIGDQAVVMQVWDTAGQERYKALTRLYYRKADAILLMFDIMQPKSLDSLKEWISEIRKYVKTFCDDKASDCCGFMHAATRSSALLDDMAGMFLKQNMHHKPLLVILGNKMDLIDLRFLSAASHEFSLISKSRTLANDVEALHFDVSAKTGLNIEQAFREIAKSLCANEDIILKTPQITSLTLDSLLSRRSDSLAKEKMGACFSCTG